VEDHNHEIDQVLRRRQRRGLAVEHLGGPLVLLEHRTEAAQKLWGGLCGGEVRGEEELCDAGGDGRAMPAKLDGLGGGGYSTIEGWGPGDGR